MNANLRDGFAPDKEAVPTVRRSVTEHANRDPVSRGGWDRGTTLGTTIVSAHMALNPDPRPGRWMLPLVVLGMLLFTYVFVSQLPGSGPDEAQAVDTQPDDTSQTGSGSSLPDGTDTGDTTVTTAPGDPAAEEPSPEVAAYVAAMQALASELTAFNTEMDNVNTAWDADPREIEYSAAEQRFTEISGNVEQWSQRVAEVQPPADLAEAHNAFVTAAQAASTEAAEVLDGLVNSPGPEDRRDAAGRFDAARQAFADALAAISG